ncbi:MAG: MFS transporter [Hespellia sp.]|nr:MFS transporter [Hespellia sp.]
MSGKIRTNYQYTIYACYLGYIVQGIINNVNPIFFIVYQKMLGLSLDKIAALIAINFGLQIVVDLLASRYVDRIGYRTSMMFAHVFAAAGLMGVGIFPYLFGNVFGGLVFATLLNAIGGGILEVLVSPIVEAAPSKEKEKAMSMLHSFYCWGCILFIAVSTIVLRIIGTAHWYFIPVVWALLPLVNILLFGAVPIETLVEEGKEIGFRALFKNKTFWLLALLMICAGASEQGMSQWASYFAETGLHINKTLGDLFGACFFCAMMGLSRTFYGRQGHKINLKRFMSGSCVLCIVSYLLAVFAPFPFLGLLGCGLCGLSVGILWPGTFSQAAKVCRDGGTAMFALLALAGDIGCMSGPTVVSAVADLFPEIGLKAGLLAAIVFPVVMLLAVSFLREKKDKG